MPQRRGFIAFEVSVNGRRLTLAGSAAEKVLTAIVSWVEGGQPTTLHVGGLSVSGGGDDVNTTWVDTTELKPGDEVVIRVVETEEAAPPIRPS